METPRPTPETMRNLNIRAFNALDSLANVEQISSGRENHPKLRLVLLRRIRDDIRTDGLPATLARWGRFLGLGALLPPKHKTGRKPLAIPVKNIYDALGHSKRVEDAAAILGCSRAYIYKRLGHAEVNRRIKDKGADNVKG
jgi:hypothetical protein